MKVVFKVCCAEEKNKTTPATTLVGSVPAESGIGSVGNGVDNAGVNIDLNPNKNANHGHSHNGHNVINTIGISGVNTGLISPPSNGIQLKPINGLGTSINSNIDQFNRVPIQPNIIGNNIDGAVGTGTGGVGVGEGTGGIMLSPGHGSINMLPPGRGGVHMVYPGHHHIQTGIRINNVPTQQNNQHPLHKGSNNMNNNGKDTLSKQSEYDQYHLQEEVGTGSIHGILGHYVPPAVDTNLSNIVQSTINWPLTTSWGNNGSIMDTSTPSSSSNLTQSTRKRLSIYPKYTNVEINITSNNHNITRISNYTPSSHSPTGLGNNRIKSK